MVTITKAIVERILADVPPEKVFWCSDGRILKNLPELEAALKEMHDDTYRYHANEAKNDFSNWVRDVMGDDNLSESLLASTSREQSAQIVNSRIAWLRNKLTEASTSTRRSTKRAK